MCGASAPPPFFPSIKKAPRRGPAAGGGPQAVTPASSDAASLPAGARPYSHVEFHPVLLLGVTGGGVACADLNSANRVNFWGSSQGPHTIGTPPCGLFTDSTKSARALRHPQRPLVSAGAHELWAAFPCGVNVMACIGFLRGNQDDAMVFNRRSIEMGIFDTLHFDAKKGDEVGCEADEDDAEAADLELEADGTPAIGSLRRPGKTVAVDAKHGNIHQAMRCAATVSDVVMTDAAFINRRHRASVRVFSMHRAAVGDKFCSRHGQKGVVGAIVPEHDLPYTADGSQFDMMINLHAFPSRMTLGQIMEMFYGILALRPGGPGFVDATPFMGRTVADMARFEMEAVLFDPLTCRAMPGMHTIAPVYYCAMVHLAQDKGSGRGDGQNGQIDPVTGQPRRGGADGALRTGAMEQEANLAWGMNINLVSARRASAFIRAASSRWSCLTHAACAGGAFADAGGRHDGGVLPRVRDAGEREAAAGRRPRPSAAVVLRVRAASRARRAGVRGQLRGGGHVAQRAGADTEDARAGNSHARERGARGGDGSAMKAARG